MVKRGQAYYVDLIGSGCVQYGLRPCLVLSNDIGNKHSSIVTVAAITSKRKTHLPTHVSINLPKRSTVMLERIQTVNQSQLHKYKSTLSDADMIKIDKALAISLQIGGQNGA